MGMNHTRHHDSGGPTRRALLTRAGFATFGLATVSGAQFISRPFLSAASTMVEACASVTTGIVTPYKARFAQYADNVEASTAPESLRLTSS